MIITSVKLKSGEEFLAEVKEDLPDTVLFKHPVVLVPDGSGGHSFSPWIATAKDTEFYIDKDLIMFSSVPVEELVDAYENVFGVKSSIIQPQSGLILG